MPDDFGMVVLRSALLLAISSLPGAQSLAAGKWLQAGRAGPLVTAEADTPATAGSWKLGLLPFPLAECLLPGESKQVHLYEARFIQLFADAASSHHDCLGAMYFTPSGNVASVSTLLEVEEYKKVVALASRERERTRANAAPDPSPNAKATASTNPDTHALTRALTLARALTRRSSVCGPGSSAWGASRYSRRANR